MKPVSRARARKPAGKRRFLRRLLSGLLLLLVAFYSCALLALLGLRWIDPPFTAVHVQRRVESWFEKGRYRKRYHFAPLSRISKSLQHAAIAAEDGRFYQHNGIDWKELRKVVADDIERGEIGRGGSTITQQLVKNLFFTTHRSFLRKGVEFALAPAAEVFLPKQRILELYLNVIEWGPGVYGAEAASQYHYGVSAARIGRERAARLAACIPAPLTRKPAGMHEYSAEILTRMNQMGW